MLLTGNNRKLTVLIAQVIPKTQKSGCYFKSIWKIISAVSRMSTVVLLSDGYYFRGQELKLYLSCVNIINEE